MREPVYAHAIHVAVPPQIRVEKAAAHPGAFGAVPQEEPDIIHHRGNNLIMHTKGVHRATGKVNR